MFFCPVPSMLQELFTSEVKLADALLSEFIYNFSFSSNRSMVSTGDPTSVLTLHSCATHQDVLDCIVQDVAHMQHTSHIGRRNNNSIRLTTIRFRAKKFMVCPVFVPFSLHCFGRVFSGKFHIYRYNFVCECNYLCKDSTFSVIF